MRRFVRAISHLSYGDRDARIRAIWRGSLPAGVGFVGSTLVLPVILVMVRAMVDLSTLGRGGSAILEFGIIGTASAVGLIISVSVARTLDGRSISEYGAGTKRQDLLDWIVGIGIGGLTYAVPTAAFLVLGRATLTTKPADSIGGPPVILAVVSVATVGFLAQVGFEEFVFRGVMIKNFAEGIATRRLSKTWSVVLAMIGSSVIFGVFHVVRQGGGGVEGRSFQLVVTSTMLGILLGAGYIFSGRLSIPIGIHLGHNLWPALLLQPENLGIAAPAVGTIGYSVSDLEMTVWKVFVGLFLLFIWLLLSRGEISTRRGLAER